MRFGVMDEAAQQHCLLAAPALPGCSAQPRVSPSVGLQTPPVANHDESWAHVSPPSAVTGKLSGSSGERDTGLCSQINPVTSVRQNNLWKRNQHVERRWVAQGRNLHCWSSNHPLSWLRTSCSANHDQVCKFLTQKIAEHCRDNSPDV